MKIKLGSIKISETSTALIQSGLKFDAKKQALLEEGKHDFLFSLQLCVALVEMPHPVCQRAIWWMQCPWPSGFSSLCCARLERRINDLCHSHTAFAFQSCFLNSCFHSSHLLAGELSTESDGEGRRQDSNRLEARASSSSGSDADDATDGEITSSGGEDGSKGKKDKKKHKHKKKKKHKEKDKEKSKRKRSRSR